MTNQKSEPSALETFVSTIARAFVILGLTLIAVIALVMWAWGLFVVPVFGLPLLSPTQGLGLVILAFLVRLMFRPTQKTTQFVLGGKR